MSEYITDIKIIEKNENPGGNFETVDTDLNKGTTGTTLHLCYKRKNINTDATAPTGTNTGTGTTSSTGTNTGTDATSSTGTNANTADSAITDIQILIGKNPRVPKGYKLIETDLNKGNIGTALYLCYKKENDITSIKKFGIQTLKIFEGKYPQPGEKEFILPTDLNKRTGGPYLYLGGTNEAGYLRSFTRFDFEIKTGDIVFGGTDANIFISIIGTLGKTSFYRLNGNISGNAFERNQTDHFSLNIGENLDSLGDIYGIILKSDMMYASPDWYCDKITITPPSGEPTEFQINAWIKDKEEHPFYNKSKLNYKVQPPAERNIFSDAIYYVAPNTNSTVEDTYTYTEGFKLSEAKVTELITKKTMSVEVGSSIAGKILSLDALKTALGIAIETHNTSTNAEELTQTLNKTMKQTINFPTSDHEKKYKIVYIEQVENHEIQFGNLKLEIPKVLSRRFGGYKEVTVKMNSTETQTDSATPSQNS